MEGDDVQYNELWIICKAIKNKEDQLTDFPIYYRSRKQMKISYDQPFDLNRLHLKQTLLKYPNSTDLIQQY